jgi:hypothetical protein
MQTFQNVFFQQRVHLGAQPSHSGYFTTNYITHSWASPLCQCVYIEYRKLISISVRRRKHLLWTSKFQFPSLLFDRPFMFVRVTNMFAFRYLCLWRQIYWDISYLPLVILGFRFGGCNAPGGRILHDWNTRTKRPLECSRHVHRGVSVLEVKWWAMH